MIISITARGRHNPNYPHIEKNIIEYIDNYVSMIDYNDVNVDYVFGTVSDWTPLYGGRVAEGPEVLDNEVSLLYDKGIGIKIPLQVENFNKEHLNQTIPLLKKYHRSQNALVIANDYLAEVVRERFPLYTIEASAILNYNLSDINNPLYDSIVLPIYRNDNKLFLDKIVDKDRVRLFINAECSYNCPVKVCYSSISEINKSPLDDIDFRCSAEIIPRKQMKDSTMLDNYFFPVGDLIDMGFNNFKMVSHDRQLSQLDRIDYD